MFLIPVILGIAFQSFLPRNKYVLDEAEYIIMAKKLHEGGAYGLEKPEDGRWYTKSLGQFFCKRVSSGEWQSKTWHTPGYPIYIYIIFLLFGQTMSIVKLGQVLLGGLNCILTYLIGKAIWDRRVGLIGGVITALYPTLLIYHQAIMSETLYITWLLLTLLFLVLAINNTKWYYLLLAGIATAAAQYIRPIFVLFPPLICAIILLIPQYRKKLYLPYLAIFLAGWLLCIMPWHIRNYYVLGDWEHFSSKGGFNLLVGNNPKANGTQVSSNSPMPPLDTKYAIDFCSMDEIERDNDALKKALSFIVHNPGKWLKLAISKLTYLWNVETRNFILAYSQLHLKKCNLNRVILIVGIILTSIPFILLSILFIRSLFVANPSQAFILLSFIIFTIISAIIFFGVPRYHLPCIPIMALYSANYLLNRKRVTLSKIQRVIFALIIVLFLTGLTCRTVNNVKTLYRSMMFDPRQWANPREW